MTRTPGYRMPAKPRRDGFRLSVGEHERVHLRDAQLREDEGQAAAWYVRSRALDSEDRDELLAMLGLEDVAA